MKLNKSHLWIYISSPHISHFNSITKIQQWYIYIYEKQIVYTLEQYKFNYNTPSKKIRAEIQNQHFDQVSAWHVDLSASSTTSLTTLSHHSTISVIYKTKYQLFFFFVEYLQLINNKFLYIYAHTRSNH